MPSCETCEYGDLSALRHFPCLHALSILQRFKERKAHGLKNNAITKFAEKYVIDMGMNPFQKKGGGAAPKE